jgi:hypothetical protein
MKKTNLLLSLCLAMTSISVAYGAARQPRNPGVTNDLPGILRLHAFNDSAQNIEAIETFLRHWDNEHTPWVGIVKGIAPGAEESLKFDSLESYHFFPYIQVNKTIYELEPADNRPYQFEQGDYIRFFDQDDGQLGAEFYSHGNMRALKVLPIFEGTRLQHAKEQRNAFD